MEGCWGQIDNQSKGLWTQPLPFKRPSIPSLNLTRLTLSSRSCASCVPTLAEWAPGTLGTVSHPWCDVVLLGMKHHGAYREHKGTSTPPPATELSLKPQPFPCPEVHFVHSHVTFSSSPINRALRLWFAMAGHTWNLQPGFSSRFVLESLTGPRMVSPYVSSPT